MEIRKVRTALITDCHREVSKAIAVRLSKLGSNLVVCDPCPDQIKKLTAEVSGPVHGITIDAINLPNVRSAVAEALQHFGSIDILINSFRGSEAKAIADLSEQDWSGTITNDLNPAFYFLKEVIPVMRDNKYGRVINLGKLEYLGLAGSANIAAVHASFFGLNRSIALEVAGDNITVNMVVEGDILDQSTSEEDREAIAGRIPVRRAGTPDDLAHAVEFFSSDNTGYVTGQTFFVCGGKSAYFSLSV
jgi:3-oxoacyl-[acyl-carrier protein] reductase/2-[hydroxy(phenyl)methyl]-succinyl-CoA dehydrogenase BbsC subunit